MSKIHRRRLLHLLGLGTAAFAMGAAGRARAGDGTGAGQQGAPGQCDGLLSTRLVKEYGVTYPFVGAGMAFISLAELAAAVTNAGGIGTIGAAPAPPPVLQAQIQAVQSMTSGLFGVDFIDATSALGTFTTEAHIDVCIQEGVKLVIFFWAAPPVAWIEKLHAAGAKVWMQVGFGQRTPSRRWTWAPTRSSRRASRRAGTTRARCRRWISWTG